MPLSSEERERIHADENARLNARDARSNSGNRYLKFFNSALGIWTLSFVLGGMITWQYGLFSTNQERAAATASSLNKSKFDLRVICDNAIATIGEKETLTYNRISSAASVFRYTPGIAGEMGEDFGVIEILNELSRLSPSDNRIVNLRQRSYDLFLHSNTSLGSFRGSFYTIGEADPVIWNELDAEKKKTIDDMLALLTELSDFASK